MKTHLAALRAFWADNRAIYAHETRLPHTEADGLRRALGGRMIEWAKTIDLEAEPQCLEEAVIVAYAHVVLACEADGASPGWETFCQPPEATEMDAGGSWRVCWESGPHAWGVDPGVVPDSSRAGDTWYTECFYSFDLVFLGD